jgi:hypothetical protein
MNQPITKVGEKEGELLSNSISKSDNQVSQIIIFKRELNVR